MNQLMEKDVYSLCAKMDVLGEECKRKKQEVKRKAREAKKANERWRKNI